MAWHCLSWQLCPCGHGLPCLPWPLSEEPDQPFDCASTPLCNWPQSKAAADTWIQQPLLHTASCSADATSVTYAVARPPLQPAGCSPQACSLQPATSIHQRRCLLQALRNDSCLRQAPAACSSLMIWTCLPTASCSCCQWSANDTTVLPPSQWMSFLHA